MLFVRQALAALTVTFWSIRKGFAIFLIFKISTDLKVACLHQSPLRRKEFLLDHIGETLSEKNATPPKTIMYRFLLFFWVFRAPAARLRRG